MTLTEQGHKHSSRNYFRILLKQDIKRQHKLFSRKGMSPVTQDIPLMSKSYPQEDLVS